MLKRLIILPISLFCVIFMSGFAWSSVQGTWEMTGKVTTTVKGKGINASFFSKSLANVEQKRV